MLELATLLDRVAAHASTMVLEVLSDANTQEVTLIVKPECLLDLATVLRDEPSLAFQQLIDVCGVDYLRYGVSDFETETATSSGFSRGSSPAIMREATGPKDYRFAVVYHLLSLQHNARIRLRVPVFHENIHLHIDSVCGIWPSANWFEREAFDLYGIIFVGHPDLRRILTDYGFKGHPFRKDFPLIGEVEVRYDATLQRVVYDPVSITPRILEPKVIRDDQRYACEEVPRERS